MLKNEEPQIIPNKISKKSYKIHKDVLEGAFKIKSIVENGKVAKAEISPRFIYETMNFF